MVFPSWLTKDSSTRVKTSAGKYRYLEMEEVKKSRDRKEPEGETHQIEFMFRGV